MYLLGKRADEITVEDIERLINNSIPEDKNLDYKRELSVDNDADKKEFLYDITALANTNGGCLIYGIEESKDGDKKGTGLPGKIVGIPIGNYDQLIQKLEDTIKTATEPNITNVVFNCLKIGDLNVLIIGIPKALGLPVMVTFKSTNKFYKRKSSGKFAVDVYELNNMFMQNQVLRDAAENYKNTRIEKVTLHKVFPLVAAISKIFVHVIPFSFQDEKMLDFSNAERMGLLEKMFPIGTHGCDHMFNVDGFATFKDEHVNKSISAFDQIHRNGIYEMYSSDIFYANSQKTRMMINGPLYMKEICVKIRHSFEILAKFKVEPPFIISITFLGIKGNVIYNNNHSWSSNSFLCDDIYFPSVIIPNTTSDIYEILRPTFDILYQGVGIAKSPSPAN